MPNSKEDFSFVFGFRLVFMCIRRFGSLKTEAYRRRSCWDSGSQSKDAFEHLCHDWQSISCYSMWWISFDTLLIACTSTWASYFHGNRKNQCRQCICAGILAIVRRFWYSTARNVRRRCRRHSWFVCVCGCGVWDVLNLQLLWALYRHRQLPGIGRIVSIYWTLLYIYVISTWCAVYTDIVLNSAWRCLHVRCQECWYGIVSEWDGIHC